MNWWKIPTCVLHRKLDHQNIVELFGVSYRLGSQSKKFLQIYMEYCDGSLEHIVYRKRDPPPCFKFKDVSECKESWEFYLKMMCGVCKGLIHVHYMGFVHRDLKLANILVRLNLLFGILVSLKPLLYLLYMF